MNRVIVTGAAGFIGSHLCEALLDAGYEVTGVDCFDPYYERSIKEMWLAELTGRPSFQFVEVDVRTDQRWLEGAFAVVHLAARPGVRASVRDPEGCLTINVGGTTSVLEACMRAGVRKVIFGSSSSVYGERGRAELSETDAQLDPVSPYGASKLAGEALCRAYGTLHDMCIVALRFFSVYGPRQRPDQAFSSFVSLMKNGNSIDFYGDGKTLRDYTHVDDVVQGILGTLAWSESKEQGFQVVNIGSAKPVRLRDAVDCLAAQLAVKPDIRMVPRSEVDVTGTYANIDKAAGMFGFAPRVAFEEGVARFIQWHEATYGH